MIGRITLFLILNFGALAIGSIFTGKGVPSDWYVSLNKAPWTPQGWVFGAAWTTIMLCFSVYLALLWPMVKNKRMLITLFSVQWLLNVSWNPLFFYFHQIVFALTGIVMLTTLIGILLYKYWNNLGVKSTLLLPYFVWLILATSLNAYVYFNN